MSSLCRDRDRYFEIGVLMMIWVAYLFVVDQLMVLTRDLWVVEQNKTEGRWRLNLS